MQYLLPAYLIEFDSDNSEREFDRVFLLGAGFSRDFGFTTTDTMITGAMEFLERDKRINVRVSTNIYDSPWLSWHLHRLQDFFLGTRIDREEMDLYSFLRITSKPEYSEIRRHLFSILTYYLFAYLLMNEVVNKRYTSFIRTLTPNDTIITFNWDVIPEVLLRTQGIPFTRHRWLHDRINVIKMHGSIDLLIDPSPEMYRDFEEINGRFELLTPNLWRAVTAEEYWPRPGAIFKKNWPWMRYDKHGLFIVPPYKTCGYSQEYISYNWRRATRVLSSCKKIVAIGYSFPDEDKEFWHVLSELYNDSTMLMEIWNPDSEVRKRVKTRLPRVTLAGEDLPFSQSPYIPSEMNEDS